MGRDLQCCTIMLRHKWVTLVPHSRNFPQRLTLRVKDKVREQGQTDHANRFFYAWVGWGSFVQQNVFTRSSGYSVWIICAFPGLEQFYNGLVPLRLKNCECFLMVIKNPVT
jgi:hypothetical protein